MSRQRAPLKAASAFFRRRQEQGKVVKLASDSTELTLATGIMSPDSVNGYIVGWNSHGRRGSADLKTEAGGGQEERSKRWRMSSNEWTWRENASARQVHPVSASFLISLRIATNA